MSFLEMDPPRTPRVDFSIATLSPTPEVLRFIINGHQVDVRVWSGSMRGIPVEAYVLSIVPVEERDHRLLGLCLPPFMRRTREVMQVDLNEPVRLCTLCYRPLESQVERENCAHDFCSQEAAS